MKSRTVRVDIPFMSIDDKAAIEKGIEEIKQGKVKKFDLKKYAKYMIIEKDLKKQKNQSVKSS